MFTMDLSSRWLDFWKRIGAQGNADAAYKMLTDRYAEPHRFYHTLEHIAHCLDEFAPARHLPNHSNEVEMAIWFHDAIYNTHRKDNEEQSAELAAQTAREIGRPNVFAIYVYGLILATKHDAIPKSIDAEVLVDVDLSILGQPPAVFGEYERDIRKEYGWVSDEQFRIGRSGLLQQLLDDNPFVYHTGFFRAKYTMQARENIQRSLEKQRG